VLNPNRIAGVLKTLRQRRGQTEADIGLPEQQDAAIGGKGAAGKIGHDLAGAQIGEQKGSFCGEVKILSLDIGILYGVP